jgi:transcriptional regulator of acetoin/glycerol metabolism
LGAKASEVAPECEPAGLSLKRAEEDAIRRALKASNDNVSEAARMLGIGRAKLYRRLAVMQE